MRFLPLFTVALLSAPAAYAISAGATGHASARVTENISILSRTPLHFGHILPGSSAGSVVVTPQNTRKINGRVRMSQGGYERATFLIEGQPNRFYSIHAPTSLAVNGIRVPPIPMPGKANVLQVTDFKTYSHNTHTVTSTGRLNIVGLDLVLVGATLVVPANVAPGFYVANVPLTVSY